MVLEVKLVNLDVTSPAATLALGLMFLRTNDAAIAAVFTLPDTDIALVVVSLLQLIRVTMTGVFVLGGT